MNIYTDMMYVQVKEKCSVVCGVVLRDSGLYNINPSEWLHIIDTCSSTDDGWMCARGKERGEFLCLTVSFHYMTNVKLKSRWWRKGSNGIRRVKTRCQRVLEWEQPQGRSDFCLGMCMHVRKVCGGGAEGWGWGWYCHCFWIMWDETPSSFLPHNNFITDS